MPLHPNQALLAALAVLVRNQSQIPNAGLQVIRLLQASGRHWPQLLDRTYILRSDALDDALRRRELHEFDDLPPGWSGFSGPPRREWDCARIILHCLAHVPVTALAEAAVIANLPQPDAVQLARIEVLAREAWRQRKAAGEASAILMERD